MNHSISHQWIGVPDMSEETWNCGCRSTMPKSHCGTVENVRIPIIEKPDQNLDALLHVGPIIPSELGKNIGSCSPIRRVFAQTIFFPKLKFDFAPPVMNKGKAHIMPVTIIVMD